ncbi:hypothetical protein [Pseudomonas sp. KB-10]|uniref:hypothetical protein n=1 Tax=Pseudomonas sp. KB-10 TaxID=2292264 RepID=UPI001BAFC147|nr:hypothetical protein [Pseudomonas sp. KB-10]
MVQVVRFAHSGPAKAGPLTKRYVKSSMKNEEIQIELDERNAHQKALLLLSYGHQLTVMSRESYEFQGAGVTNPRLLRDANEILHRVFQALTELQLQSEKSFSLSGISHWISCEEKTGSIVQASNQAFSMALQKCKIT